MSDDLLYLFTGNAEVFIQNRINRIISSYDKFNVGVIKIDFETEGLTRVLEEASTPPFLEELKIIVVRNPSVLADKDYDDPYFKSFINYLKKPAETTVLIFDAANIKINTNNPLYDAFRKYTMIIDYNSEQVEIVGWIKRTCQGHNIQIDDDAVNLFLDYINENQIRMINELDKLMDYCGNGGHITVDTIKLLVSKDLSKEIFKLITAIVAHDKDQINEIYSLLSSQTKDISNIIALVSSKMKELLTTAKLLKKGYSQSDIAKFYSITNGHAYYLVKDSSNFKVEDLEKFMIEIANLDYQIKTNSIDKNVGFELLLLKY